MLFLALQERKNRTERPVILAARNAHKAFLYSCALLDVDVEWLFPEGAKSLCACPITAEQVPKAEKIKCFRRLYYRAGLSGRFPGYQGNCGGLQGGGCAAFGR